MIHLMINHQEYEVPEGRTVLAYTIRRLLVLIPMLFVISFFVYLGIDLTPGDAVSYMVSAEALAGITDEQLAAMREALGLNDPFLVRYFRWLGGVLQGDFGYSPSSGVPIYEIVFDRLPATLELSIAALLISTIAGTALGTISALKRGSLADNLLTVSGMIGVSVPQFIFGLVAIVIFSLNLKWFPVGGRLMPGYETFWDHLPHLVLPALVLSSTGQFYYRVTPQGCTCKGFTYRKTCRHFKAAFPELVAQREAGVAVPAGAALAYFTVVGLPVSLVVLGLLLPVAGLAGFAVTGLPMSEFQKADGGVTCLSLLW